MELSYHIFQNTFFSPSLNVFTPLFEGMVSEISMKMWKYCHFPSISWTDISLRTFWRNGLNCLKCSKTESLECGDVFCTSNDYFNTKIRVCRSLWILTLLRHFTTCTSKSSIWRWFWRNFMDFIFVAYFLSYASYGPKSKCATFPWPRTTSKMAWT